MRIAYDRLVCFVFLVMAATASWGQDAMSIGSTSASGSQVSVPVFVQDNAGTLLNTGDTADKRIHSLSFKIDYAPASAVASISISRSGVLAGASPLFESTPSTATSASYLASFAQHIPFTGGADQVATVSITLSSSAAAGSTITLTLDGSATSLANQAGTTEETAANGQLSLSGGTVSVPVPAVSLSGPPSVRFGSDATLTVQLTSAAGSTASIGLSSSSASVTVPDSVTIPAGQSSATFTARGASVGSATLTATLPPALGGGSTNTSLSVTAPTLSLTAGNTPIGVGEDRGATLSIDGPLAAAITIALSSSNTGVASVPDSVQMPAGLVSTTFNIRGTAQGGATIAAMLPTEAGGGTATAEVSVIVFAIPAAPGGPRPADGAVDVPSPVFLSWNAVPNVSGYDVYFGTPATPPFVAATVGTTHAVTVAPGTKYFWRIVARNPAGETSSPVWSFTAASGTGCQAPGVPTLTTPASATTGVAYTVSWSAVSGTTEYQVDESADPNFGVKSTSTVAAPTTSATFTHTTSSDVTYYYRVRARNVSSSCDQTGNYSSISTVVVRGSAAPEVRIIPVAGSTPGSGGSFFRTSVQIHNPGSTPISGTFVFHQAGRSGGSNDPKLNYTLGPRESRSYDDLLVDMGLSGLGSVDLIANFGALPRAVVRIFNDGAENGTSGMTEPLVDPEDALAPGDTGLLIGPANTRAARFNIGVRTLDEPATILFTILSRTGAEMKQVRREYPRTFFEQRPSHEVLDTTLGDNDVIEIKVERGRAIVYGASTDNITQDPSLQVETKSR